MIRKLPIVVSTPFVPGTPGQPEQVLCPPKQPTRTIPDRGQPQRSTYCYTPVVVIEGSPVVGPQICVQVWGVNLGS